MTAGESLYTPGGVGDILVNAIERHAASVAVVDGAHSVTYETLGRHVAQAVVLLRERGARPGDRIVQIARNRYEVLVLIVACYVGGFVSVPLAYSGELDEHAFVIRDSEPALLVIEQALAAKVPALAEASGRAFEVLTHEALAERLGAPSLEAPSLGACAPDLDGAACVRMVYTGGTTGRPKGVMASTSALAFACLLLAHAHDFTHETAFLLCAPMSHGAGSFIAPVLSKGGRLVIHQRFDLDALVDALRDGTANSTLLVPTMLYALLDHPRSREIPRDRVRRLIYGAAPMSAARLKEALDRFGCGLAQSYWQTEVPSAITWLAPSDHAREPALLASAGKPYPGVKLRLMAGGEPLPRRSGQVGEICVQAPHVMSGYWRQPELTAQAMAGGWLHTGDLAYEDANGHIFIVDRLKDLVISGGFNIYPSEVEAALEAHPAVRSSAVVGVPHEKWGEAAHAFVVLREGAAASEDELQAFVRGRLGPVKTPKAVAFIPDLPLTKVGKVDKKALRAPYWQGADRHVH